MEELEVLRPVAKKGLDIELIKARPIREHGMASIKISESGAYLSKLGTRFLDLKGKEKLVMARDRKSGTYYIGKAPEGVRENAITFWQTPSKGGGQVNTRKLDEVEHGKYYIGKDGIRSQGTVLFPLTPYPEQEEK